MKISSREKYPGVDFTAIINIKIKHREIALKLKSGWKWLLAIAAILLAALLVQYLVSNLLNIETQQLDQESKRSAPGEFLLLPAGEVHYRLAGPNDAPLVVLVHGFSVPSYVWDPTFSALEEAGYQVLAFDLFGRGYSERPQGNYDIDLFTKQLDDLLTALEIDEPVVLSGLSMGGPIVARFARTHPERVSGVILIAPEVIQTTPGDIFPLNVPLLGEFLMGAVMEPFVLPRLQAADFVHPERYPDWEAQYRVQLQYKGTGKALLSTIRNLTEQDPEEEYQALEETGIPLLLIWGEEDQTISRDHIEILGQLMPKMQVEVVPDAGHLPHYEQDEIVDPLIINFLNAR